jgi:hypothetical protein
MKKKILLALVLFCTINITLHAQYGVKYERSVSDKYKAIASVCNTEFKSVLKLRKLVQSWNIGCNYTIAKGENNYYFITTIAINRSYEYGMLKNNSLDLNLYNGEKIQLFPCNEFFNYLAHADLIFYDSFNKEFISSSTAVQNCTCSYEISKEQLLKLSENLAKSVFIHYTSKWEIPKSIVDEDGKIGLQAKIDEICSSTLKSAAKYVINN